MTQQQKLQLEQAHAKLIADLLVFQVEMMWDVIGGEEGILIQDELENFLGYNEMIDELIHQGFEVDFEGDLIKEARQGYEALKNK